MNQWSSNRLTVIGPKAQLRQFVNSRWNLRLRARHGELLENSGARYVSRFETEEPPIASLRSLSRRWPELTMLLDYEVEPLRIKGLVKAKAGTLDSYRSEY